MPRCVLVATAALLSSFPIARAASGSCLATAPPNPPFARPPPYEVRLNSDHFWYGTDALWTYLPVDGKWGGLVQKLPFWSKGYDWRKEPERPLTITGRRLDGKSLSFTATRAENAFIGSPPAIMTGFDIPTTGCWQLTACYHDHALTFVVLVKP